MDWASAGVNFLGILVAIAIAIYLGPWAASRQAKRNQQERLLRDLLNTWQMVSNPVYQSAINHIPLDFSGCPEVLDARRAYLSACNVKESHEAEQRAKQIKAQVDGQTNLIAAIAKVLEFKLTADELRATSYLAQGFVDRETALIRALHSWPRIADALELQNRLWLEGQSKA